MAKGLWISSTLTETGDYRDSLKDRGHAIEAVSFACEALPKLGQSHNIYFLDPYYLSWGRIGDYPKEVSLDDPIGLGLWTYDRIRKITSAPLILIPFNIRRENVIIKRLEDKMSKDSLPVFIRDLTRVLPSQFGPFVEQILEDKK